MRRGWPVVIASWWLAAAVPADAQRQPLPPPPSPPAQMPAATSVPNPLAGFHPGPRDLYQSPDGSDRFRLDSQYPVPPPQLSFPGGYIPGPYYGPYYPVYTEMPIAYTAFARPRAMRGRLSLETVPERAQVYADGFYVGLAEEFGLRGRPLDLSVGSHYIELRSPDHETLSFNVMIEANETIRYRGDMRRITAPPAAASSAATPPLAAAVPARAPVSTSVYVIPKCYAGNKPPAQPLPAGCDRKNLQTRK